MCPNDLFNLVTNPSDLTFQEIRDSKDWKKQRDSINELWNQYQPYADRHFAVEVGRQFYPRFWEMWLTCKLLNQGFKLEEKKGRKSAGPDICILDNQKHVWIEAQFVEKGNGPDAIENNEFGCGFHPHKDKVNLRYLNAVSEKHEKYKIYLKKEIIQPDEPYVIAIGAIGILGYKMVQSIFESVFGIGQYTVEIDTTCSKIVNEYYPSKPQIIKESGSPVSTTRFLTKKANEISAILIANPCPIEMTSPKLSMILNPNAINPLSTEWLKEGHVYWVEKNEIEHRVRRGN